MKRYNYKCVNVGSCFHGKFKQTFSSADSPTSTLDQTPTVLYFGDSNWNPGLVEPKMAEIMRRLTVQRRMYDDQLYCDGNKLCQSVLGKQAVVLIDEEEFLHKQYRA